MTLNGEWHRSHRMPTRATREQRVRWHAAHAMACSCREIPLSTDVVELLKGRRKPAVSK
ncbi:hypothetical protein SAMN05216525_102445 [Bradyrhizobium sp. Gha]|nr:hypothetical protein SAMN05216525_102445 [Bradyrhizobium sp. Gha]